VRLNLRNCHRLTDVGLESVALCHNIQDLNLSGCEHITDAGICLVMNSCRSIHHLNIAYTQIGDWGLSAVGMCRSLEYFSIAGCQGITDLGLSFLEGGMRTRHRLRLLDMSECEHITDKGLHTVANMCPNLQCLLIADVGKVSVKGINHVAVRCKHIKWIDISGCIRITDASIESVAKARSPLTRLDLENNNITDKGVKMLTHGCRLLTHLNLVDCDHITDESLSHISQHLKRLEVLSLADNTQFTSHGLHALIGGGSMVTRLRKLNLTNCHSVTNHTLVFLLTKCTELESLVLRFCENISADGLESVHQAKYLCELDLHGCHRVNDVALEHVALNQSIQTLILSALPNISDTGIKYLVRGCPSLRYLSLDSCVKLTDQSMFHIAFTCMRLAALSVRNCPHVSHPIYGKRSYARLIDVYSEQRWTRFRKQGDVLMHHTHHTHNSLPAATSTVATAMSAVELT
jgi:F-box/leucine-rich repeat protein 2/20